jgi:predicted ATPase/predicted Ser/Thr protein kinase
MIGRTISHYEILEKLGEGGMGVVYKAHDIKLDRTVALKFLPQHLTKSEEDKQRFSREAKAAAALNHPNICTIHNVEEHDGNQFIVMEYVDGKTLRDYVGALRETPLRVEQALSFALQITEALSEAHKKGIIHRDVKPDNIMVTADNRVKVMDFGLAKFKGSANVTKTGGVVGSIAYMSPEQIQGEEVDNRTDLWALGVVLYELLSARSTFHKDYEASIIYSILNETPTPLSNVNPDIPKKISGIVEKLMEKHPDNRYNNDGELLTDLRSCLRIQSSEVQETDPSSEHPLTIPQPLTSFVGRTRELSEIKELFMRTRLLTLTGIAGSGKTRLAIQLAHDIASKFKDGVFFIDLVVIQDHNLVASIIARSLNVKEVTGQSVMDSLISALSGEQRLLVLDNFEHVIGAAGVVVELLSSARKIKIVVTSREALNIRGEQEYPVPPLSLPKLGTVTDHESLKDNEAIALFVQRAKNVKPNFELTADNVKEIAAICVRLDGLPLALELAAARIKILSPGAILDRLRDRFKLLVGGATDQPERQQTLRAAIAWSYDLLSEDEQMIHRRLAVFTGGCTLDAAEFVCHTPEPLKCDILDGISSLVNKNLLRVDESASNDTRFLMLESIRDFGMEQLNEAGEKDIVLNTHQDYYLQLCETAEPKLTGPEQVVWMQRFDEEHANLRAALELDDHSSNGLEKRLKIASILWRYWLSRGYFNEGRNRLADLIRNEQSTERPELLAKMTLGAGTLAHNNGDYVEAYSLISKCLGIYRSLNDTAGIATTLNNLGWAAFRMGNYREAWSLSEESIELHRTLSDKRGIAFSFNNLGWIAHHRGEFRDAQKYHEECLEIRRLLGDQRNIAFSLNGIAWALQKQGNTKKAIDLTDQALKIFEEIGEQQLYAFTLCIKADALIDDGKSEEAGLILKEHALPIFKDIEDTYGCAYSLNSLGVVQLLQGKLDEAIQYFGESYRLRNEIGDQWGIAQSLCNKGRTLLYKDKSEVAREYLIKSLTIRRELDDKSGLAESIEGLSEYYFFAQAMDKAFYLITIAKKLREVIDSPRLSYTSTVSRKIESYVIDSKNEIIKQKINALHEIEEYDTLLHLVDEYCINNLTNT